MVFSLTVSCTKETELFIQKQHKWENLCRSYLVEARWFYSGYAPTLEEYLENAWISMGGHAGIAHAYLLLESTMRKTCLDSFKINGSSPIYWSSLIAQLSDDLGTSKAEIMRGDLAKSIQYYMMEKGVTEEQAQDHIKGLISFSWRKLNETIAKNSNPKSIILTTLSLNMARTAQCIYQHVDGVGKSTRVTRDHLMSLIAEPIAMFD
ncbi:putative terpene synthase 9 [Camellia lanceoleosa]|uniref:Terpene synthase 9 n=1 Tax=Camellia lanceoleosa TaxID=1840588 RepID=A0ACC0GYS6_9ERIC|nr:putative terpene synthase 9 [Camellia lanceoleosa]